MVGSFWFHDPQLLGVHKLFLLLEPGFLLRGTKRPSPTNVRCYDDVMKIERCFSRSMVLAQENTREGSHRELRHRHKSVLDV